MTTNFITRVIMRSLTHKLCQTSHAFPLSPNYPNKRPAVVRHHAHPERSKPISRSQINSAENIPCALNAILVVVQPPFVVIHDVDDVPEIPTRACFVAEATSGPSSCNGLSLRICRCSTRRAGPHGLISHLHPRIRGSSSLRKQPKKNKTKR